MKKDDIQNRQKEAERRITLLIMLGVIALLLVVIIIGIIIRTRSFL